MARRKLLLSAFAFACASASGSVGADPAEVDDAFPGTIRMTPGAEELTLNGTGERTIFFFRIYAIGLYLPQRRNTLDGVLSLPGPKRLQLFMLRELSAKQVRDYLAKRIADRTQADEMAVMQARMQEVGRIIDSVGVLRKGDVLAMDHIPDKGTIIRINGVAHGDPVAGDEFFHTLLRIWMGPRARSHALRDALLGRVTG